MASHIQDYLLDGEWKEFSTSFYTKISVPPPKVLADIIESITGAIYIDSARNLALVKEKMFDILAPALDTIHPNYLQSHPTVELYKLTDVQVTVTRTIEDIVEDVEVIFVCSYFVNDELLASARSSISKHDCATRSAILSLQLLFDMCIQALFG